MPSLTPAEAREKLHKFACELVDQLGKNGADFLSETNAAETIEAAILAAFPQLTPSADVLEGARLVADNWYRRDQVWHESLAKQIAAFATAHAAAEREAGRREIEERDGYLISCPWCGEDQRGKIMQAQMAHLIECGDKYRAAIRTRKP